MKTIHILGHDNVALGLMLDIIYRIYNNEYKIKIYNNILPSENSCFHLPFLHDKLETSIIQCDKGEGKIEYGTDDLMMLSGSSPKSKALILQDFQTRFGIDINAISSLIHPNAIIGNGCHIGHGVVIEGGVIIGPFTRLDDFVTVKRNVSIGHHDTVGTFSTFNPGCNIGGQTEIGKHVTIGLGASVFDNITIGDNSIIGGGSVVTKSIPEYTLAFGSPAKEMKKLG